MPSSAPDPGVRLRVCFNFLSPKKPTGPAVGKQKLRAKCHRRKSAYRPEVFDIGRAKRMIRFDGSSANQGIGRLDAVGEGILFDGCGRGGADGFGKRQDTKLELAE